jgi:hypothetical protein
MNEKTFARAVSRKISFRSGIVAILAFSISRFFAYCGSAETFKALFFKKNYF